MTETDADRLIHFLSNFEEALIQKNNYNYLNKNFMLCLFITACCFEQIKKYNQQIYMLNRILELLSWTEGRQSYEFKLISNYKREAFQAMDKKESEVQL